MTSETMALYAARILSDKKASNVVVLSVGDRTIIADYMIIASGDAEVQVRALCDSLKEKMAESQVDCRRVEGYAEGRWVVCDFGDILVHIFHKEEREYDDLDRLWSDGTNVKQFEP